MRTRRLCQCAAQRDSPRIKTIPRIKRRKCRELRRMERGGVRTAAEVPACRNSRLTPDGNSRRRGTADSAFACRRSSCPSANVISTGPIAGSGCAVRTTPDANPGGGRVIGVRRRAAGIDVRGDAQPDRMWCRCKDRHPAGARDDRLRGFVIAATEIMLIGRKADQRRHIGDRDGRDQGLCRKVCHEASGIEDGIGHHQRGERIDRHQISRAAGGGGPIGQHVDRGGEKRDQHRVLAKRCRRNRFDNRP